MKPNFLELAQTQFLNLQDEILDIDRHSVGGGDETHYEVSGFKFKIKVDGYWEKATWFDYEVLDEQNKIIESGNHCFY